MKKLIKIFFVILLIFILAFAWTSFASTWGSVANNDLWEGINMLQKLINMIYLILRPFLVVAWKFLSNDFVYGSAFGIDNVLWKLWQLTRTFANYMIWIVFIWSLFIYFFKSDSNYSWKKNIPRIVIASVVINASWFLLAVLIDISTILTLTAWSIWSQFNPWFEKNKNASTMLPIVINPDTSWSFLKIAWPDWQKYDACIKDKEGKVKNQPCVNFLDWSYEIIWAQWSKKIEWIDTKSIEWSSAWMLISIFRSMNWIFLQDNSNNSSWIFIISFLKIFLFLLLLIPFAVLSVILIIRVLVLRVVIPLSPVILWAFILWLFNSQIKNKFNDIMALIFQPAYIVLMLSIWFIFIQSLYAMIPTSKDWSEEKSKNIIKQFWFTAKTNDAWKDKKTDEINLWSNWKSIFSIQTTYETWHWSNTNASDWKNILSFISWIVVNIIWICILRSLVFMALKASSFTKKIADTTDKLSKQVASSAPILPWWHSLTSLNATKKHLESIPQLKAQQQSHNLKNIWKWSSSNSKKN